MDYNKQGKDFLTKFDLLLDIKKATPQKSPLWAKKEEKHGINYWITLKENKTGGKVYSFDFWDSIANLEYGNYGFAKLPTAYDILACLNTFDDGVSFEDFCYSYGYDDDSITAKKTFKAVMVQNEGLKEILSEKAIEALNNIQ